MQPVLAAQLNFKQFAVNLEEGKKSRFTSFLSFFSCYCCVLPCYVTQRVTYLIEAYETEVHAIFRANQKIETVPLCIEVETVQA